MGRRRAAPVVRPSHVYPLSVTETRRSMERLSRSPLRHKAMYARPIPGSAACGVTRWDAHLYKLSMVRAQLSPTDLGLVLDACARKRRSEPAFLTQLAEEVRAKAARFSLRDGAVWLHASAKLSERDDLLFQVALHIFYRRTYHPDFFRG